MRVDLLRSQSWEEWNENLREDFQLKKDEQGRVYQGLSHAVNELVLGTAIFFSHKKHLTLIEGKTWAFEAILPHLYKLGFEVQVIPESQLPKTEATEAEWQTWVEALSKETNFVLWSEDHPVTGEYRDLSVMEKCLAQKRILSFAVSHSSHHFKARELSPYGAQIQSWAPEISWARLGSRVRTPPLFVHRQIWGAIEAAQIRRLIQVPRKEDKALVERTEKVLRDQFGFQLFSEKEDRLFDRVVVWHPTRNGSAIAELLKRHLQLSGTDSVSGCESAVLPELNAWWKPIPSDEILRGLLILDLDILTHPSFLKTLKESLEESIFRQV